MQNSMCGISTESRGQDVLIVDSCIDILDPVILHILLLGNELTIHIEYVRKIASAIVSVSTSNFCLFIKSISAAPYPTPSVLFSPIPAMEINLFKCTDLSLSIPTCLSYANI